MKRLGPTTLLKGREGFSLTEMLITVLLYAIIMGACYLALSTGSSSWQVSDVKIELQQELRKAMDWLVEDLRQAGVSTVSGVTADGNPYNTITFKKAAGASGGAVVWSSDAFTYARGGSDGNQLIRTLGTASRTVALDITSLEFVRQAADPDIVDISLGAQKDSLGGHSIARSLNVRVLLRN